MWEEKNLVCGIQLACLGQHRLYDVSRPCQRIEKVAAVPRQGGYASVWRNVPKDSGGEILFAGLNALLARAVNWRIPEAQILVRWRGRESLI